MATFGLPDSQLLSEKVREVLPPDYDGVCKEPGLAQVFEQFTTEHTVSEKLRNIYAASSSFEQIFCGLAETFPEAEAAHSDFWSLEIDSYETLVFWFQAFQKFGPILDNGVFISIKDSLLIHHKYIDSETLLDLSVYERAAKFAKYVRDRGSYVSVKEAYPFLYRVSDEEALKLLASRITIEEYSNYCELGCTTYEEIFNGHVAELPSEWRDFLMEKMIKNRE